MRSKTIIMRMLQAVGFILLLSVVNCGTSSCEKQEKISALVDAAVDLMLKVKSDNSSCPKENDLTCRKPVDCDDLYRRGYNKSGVYTIWPISRRTPKKGLNVSCHMVPGEGGWTVIQRRGNYGRANDFFNQDWANYRKGFGNIETDFWLGNDNIFAITNQKTYTVYFGLEDQKQNKAFAYYDNFWIDDEFNKYTLHISGYRGTAGDSMSKHNTMKFTTKDQDNDIWKGNCALLNKSGWWFTNCWRATLNGEYNNEKEGIKWLEWKNEYLTRVEIKIKPNAL